MTDTNNAALLSSPRTAAKRAPPTTTTGTTVVVSTITTATDLSVVGGSGLGTRGPYLSSHSSPSSSPSSPRKKTLSTTTIKKEGNVTDCGVYDIDHQQQLLQQQLLQKKQMQKKQQMQHPEQEQETVIGLSRTCGVVPQQQNHYHHRHSHHHQHQQQSSPATPSVTSDATTTVDGMACCPPHTKKCGGRTSPHQQHPQGGKAAHHVHRTAIEAATGEAIDVVRNPLASYTTPASSSASVDSSSSRHIAGSSTSTSSTTTTTTTTTPSTKRILPSVPSSPHQHHPRHRHQSGSGQSSRSSSASPTRHTTHANTSVTATTTTSSNIAKGSHKKILPPSPIVIDSHVRGLRKKADSGGSSSSSGGGGGGTGPLTAPIYSSPSPPIITERSISCPSPSSTGQYSGPGTPATTPGSPYLDSKRKDDIVLPPTRSTAAGRARFSQSTSTPITTTASIGGTGGGVMTTTTSADYKNTTGYSADQGKTSTPSDQHTSSNQPSCAHGSIPHHSASTATTGVSNTSGGTSGGTNSSSTANDKYNLTDSDNTFIQNFYKTSQKLAELNDARPKYKIASDIIKSRAGRGGSAGIRSGYNTSPNHRSNYGTKKSKTAGYSHTIGNNGSYTGISYKGNYSSIGKDNGYGSAGNTSDSIGIGNQIVYSSNTAKSSGYHSKGRNKKSKGHPEGGVSSVEEKPARPSKDHVYYTADRPSRSKIPGTSGSSHRASSVPARRSMSVSEFAGTSVDPQPGNGQSEGENLEKVKSKLMSMWNNVKYGWTLNRKTSFRYDSPIFLLGEHYHRRHDEVDGKNKEDTQSSRVNNMELFKMDFASRLWFTYRRDFEPLKGTKLTTDCGWGCMIRSGQMMLAQGFITHFFGRSWRIQNRDRGLNVYRQIVKWFADYQQCPFSVHQLVDIGSTLGRKPGEWYGPATVATMLRVAMEKSYECQPVLRELCVYVAFDCTVYLQEVADLCMSGNNNTLVKMPDGDDASVDGSHEVPGPGSSWKRAVVVLIPVRLGGESLNTVYIPCLQNLLAEEHCIGIIGGKPKHSLYFVGWQDKKLIYLDPHYCQDNVDVMSGDFNFSSFHCITPRKLPFEDMDPSCTIGFYCRNQEEFEKFVNQTRDLTSNLKQKGLYPAFAFVDGRSGDLQMDKLELNEERYLRIRYVDQDGKLKQPTSESDDFVVL